MQLKKKAFDAEIMRVKYSIKNKNYESAYYFLERAHVIGQRFIWPHTYTHLLFLFLGFKRRDYREIIGQLARIPTGMLGSAFSVLPEGNTGGANVSMFKVMPISDEIKSILKD